MLLSHIDLSLSFLPLPSPSSLSKTSTKAYFKKLQAHFSASGNALRVNAPALVLPVAIDAVASLMERKGFDKVLADLTGFGLDSWSHVYLKGAILAFNGANLIQHRRRKGVRRTQQCKHYL